MMKMSFFSLSVLLALALVAEQGKAYADLRDYIFSQGYYTPQEGRV